MILIQHHFKLLKIQPVCKPLYSKPYQNLSGWKHLNPWQRSGNIRCYCTKKTDVSMVPDILKPPDTHGNLSFKTLLKPFLFTVGFSGVAFVGCTIYEYERIRHNFKEHWKHSQRLWPSDRGTKRLQIRQQINEFWNSLTEGQRFFAPILFLNMIVFAAWRIPKFQPAMLTYFASNPAAKVLCWPMILSAFSHYAFFHLAANMFVLHSFSEGVVRTLGKEQAALLYLSAGVLSSFTSFIFKVIVSKPGLSVGASGAIMAFLGFVCTKYPDAQLSIIFLPMFTFSAGTAIKVAVGADLMGCLLGWRFFDHAAHLGGAVTGILWAYFGNDYIWHNRGRLMKKWSEFRENSV